MTIILVALWEFWAFGWGYARVQYPPATVLIIIPNVSASGLVQLPLIYVIIWLVAIL